MGVEKIKKFILFIPILVALASPVYAEMYKWVDEKGTVHFTDDLSKVPERYLPDIELRKVPEKSAAPESTEKPIPPPSPKTSEPEGMEVPLLRKSDVLMAEVILNGRVKQHFIVDTGASYTLINKEMAKELNLTIGEDTLFLPIATVSGVILAPLVTLKSVQVGKAEVENVEALIHDMPSHSVGLLGNSFLSKFKVVLDSMNGKMTLFSMVGPPSPDRPGGYGRDYWEGRFRYFHQNLAELRRMKTRYENRGSPSDLATPRKRYESRGSLPELNRINNAIRYFENQLNELERKASLAGVPRNWRD